MCLGSFFPSAIRRLLPALALVSAIGCFAPQKLRAQFDRQEFFDPRLRQHEKIRSPERDIFPGNTFTFARVRFRSNRSLSGGPWYTDFPDSDINFPLRLEEVTTIEVNHEHVVLDLTSDALFNYPFLYMLEVGTLQLSEVERERLRSYLLRGGFLMIDDFWGESEWSNWQHEISQVLPPEEFPMVRLTPQHELFHVVFDVEEVPQVPAIGIWEQTGVSFERSDAREARCWGISDHNDRLMVVVMHNTDLGDGWEREGENPEYFREFSVKKAYPMGINIVVYAMTH